MNDLISVIVPAYNAEEYIGECLDSLLCQTYENLQIIVVNDGSTDRTGEIIARYQKKDARILALQQPNGGVSAARNLALEHMEGRYVTFSDSDDTSEPDKIAFLYALLLTHDAEIAHCGYNRVEEGQCTAIHGTGSLQVQTSEESLACIVEGRLFTGSLCTKLFDSGLFSGIRFDVSLKDSEDILVCYSAFKKARKTVFADTPKYNYIIRDSSACRTMGNLRSYTDKASVAKTMYADSVDTPLEKTAAKRYIQHLSGLYRVLLYEKKRDSIRLERVKQELLRMDALHVCKELKIRLNLRMLIHMPFLYKALYKVYDSIRIPNRDC